MDLFNSIRNRAYPHANARRLRQPKGGRLYNPWLSQNGFKYQKQPN